MTRAVRELSAQLNHRGGWRRAGDAREHVVAVSARIMNERQGVPRLRANVRLVSRGAHDSSSEVSDFDRGS